MPIHLDHYQPSARNIYSTVQQLREDTGLGFYDGFVSTDDIANKIFPPGGGTYLEVEGVIDAGVVATDPDRLYMHPAGQPVFKWPGLVEPHGISYIEMDGTGARDYRLAGTPCVHPAA